MPRGWVEITLERLELDAPALGLDQLPADEWLYALAEIGPSLAGAAGRHRLGRSGRIRMNPGSVEANGHFDLGGERMVWTHGVRAADGESVDLRLTLWLDRGDQAPQQRLQWTVAIDPPWMPGPRTADEQGHRLCYRVDRVIEREDDPVELVLALGAPEDQHHNVQVIDEPVEAIVGITAIDGLYRPVAGLDPSVVAMGTPLHNAPLSEVVAGYISNDHRGRIFINRVPNGTWTADAQYIDLTAEVWIEGLEANTRDDVRVTWTVIVPDDPSDDDPAVHREAGALLDPTDHDVHGEHLGARGYDNEGANPHYGQANHVWEQLGTFDLQVGAAQPAIGLPPLAAVDASNQIYLRPATTATEAVDDDGRRYHRRSGVRLHCPDVRGDRLVVRATVEGQGYRVLPAQTGVMTMWNRIDLEYRKMQTAFHLPVADMPAAFESAFVQLDVHALADVADIDRLPTTQFDTFLSQDTTFQHRGDPGWFCLIAAKLLGAAPAANPRDRFTGPRTLRRATPGDEVMLDAQGPLDYSAQTNHNRFEYIDVPGDVPKHATVRVTWGPGHAATTVKFDRNARERFQLGGQALINTIRQRLQLLGYQSDPHDSTSGQATPADRNALLALRQDYPRLQAAWTAPNAQPNTLARRWTAWLCEHMERNGTAAPPASNPTDLALQQAAQRSPTYFTRIWIQPHDVQNRFTAGNALQSGRTSHAHAHRLMFGPRRTETIAAGASQGDAAGGYGAPAAVDVRVTELSGELKGYSPGATVLNEECFSGRTLVATRHPGYDDQGQPIANYRAEVSVAIIHELVHAFGMPHKCAAWDTVSPRATTCCMNYPPNWMVDAHDALVVGTADRVGPRLCARHIKEVRRVHLEDNAALQARGWT
ncbi:MAG: hypothetical protein KDK70_02660 [Myxococcales bacterium]|nr:hypothetical protein [Myxococcales bacterium]